MTYSPLAATAQTGEAYFRDRGFLTPSMDLLISGDTVFPTYDAQRGQAATLTDSSYQFASGQTDPSWIGWDFASDQTELLAVVYTHVGTNQYQYINVNIAVCDAAADYQPGYLAGNVAAISTSTLIKRLTSSSTTLASDTTIWGGQATVPVKSDPVFGMGIHCKYDGSNTTVSQFIRLGSGQWVTLLTATDSSSPHTVFRSIKLSCLGKSERFITPFYVWGS